MDKPDNPPAFPEPLAISPQGDVHSGESGMTLRDYFAAHCPITFEMSEDYNMSGENPMGFYAALRYEYADAMLAERSK